MDLEIKNQFEKALASKDLIGLVERMKKQGFSQLRIYESFDLFRDFLRKAERESDEDDVMDVMDLITGWCSRDAMLFPHNLNNEEIEKYKRNRDASESS